MRFSLIAYLFLFGFIWMGCNDTEEPVTQEANLTTETEVRKADIRHAKSFIIEYHSNFKVIKVFNPWQGMDQAIKYLLVERGSQVIGDYEGYHVIEVPVRTMVCLSTTHLPMVKALNATDRLVGVETAKFIYDEEIRQMVETGDIKEVAKESSVNLELLMDLNPDMVMTYGVGSASYDNFNKLEEMDMKVVINAEYMENTPLGRAEWIKFFAAFLNKENEAERIFKNIEREYLMWAEKVKGVQPQPLVLSGLPFKDIWSLPGGDSFGAHYLYDAGAGYPFSDNEQKGSLHLSIEEVYNEAADADVWLNTTTAESIQDIINQDERFADFKPIQTGEVYNNNKRMNEYGGNDFYESGVLNPHIILQDLIKIFHPGLAPGHELFYYHKLPRVKQEAS